MFKNKMFLSLQSFVALPILAANFTFAPLGAMLKLPTDRVSAIVENRSLALEAADNKQHELEEKAKKIDAYFSDKGLPAAGHGKKFVEVAEENGIPYTLLPAIAMRESTGGKFSPKDKFNYFGWGSAKIRFNSVEEAIETVGEHISGHNPRTERYYKDKDINGILQTYNPPSVVERYSQQVQAIMKTIDEYPVKA